MHVVEIAKHIKRKNTKHEGSSPKCLKIGGKKFDTECKEINSYMTELGAQRERDRTLERGDFQLHTKKSSEWVAHYKNAPTENRQEYIE